MSLRDYFATHLEASQVVALTQTLAEKFIDRKCPEEAGPEKAAWSFVVEAHLRYLFADAMIEARKATK